MAKRLFAVALAAGVMSTGLLAGATDASAIATKTYTKPYSKSANFYSKPLGRCVRTTLSGKVTFKHYYYKQKGAISDAFLGVKLINPTMRTTVLTKCTGGKSATVTKMAMTQRWYESTKCKLNVAIAMRLPVDRRRHPHRGVRQAQGGHPGHDVRGQGEQLHPEQQRPSGRLQR